MTVQTTFAGGVNPWAAFMDMKPERVAKVRRLKREGPPIQRPRDMAYRLKLGSNESPTGGSKVYTNWGELIGKIDKTNWVICKPEDAQKIGMAMRKWCAKRKKKASVTTDKNFGLVYLRWL